MFKRKKNGFTFIEQIFSALICTSAVCVFALVLNMWQDRMVSQSENLQAKANVISLMSELRHKAQQSEEIEYTDHSFDGSSVTITKDDFRDVYLISVKSADNAVDGLNIVLSGLVRAEE